MVNAIFELAVHYGLTWEGRTIESLIANGYEVSVKFDDSIIQDKAADINQGTLLVGAGLLSRKKFMTDTLGYTADEAESEIRQIADESKTINAIEVNRLYGDLA